MEYKIGDEVDDSLLDEEECEELEETVKDVFAKALPSQLQNWKKNADALKKNMNLKCWACPKSKVTCLEGIQALINHAKTFQKKNLHVHRGYAKALAAFMTEHFSAGEENHAAVRVAVAEGSEVVWPPVVVLCNTGMIRNGEWETKRKEQLPARLNDEAQVKLEYVPLHDGEGRSVGMSLLVFEGSECGEGFRHARELSAHFYSKQRGLADWEKLKMRYEREGLFGPPRSGVGDLYGYLARRVDMEVLDPRKRYVKEWTVRPLDDVTTAMRNIERKAKEKRVEELSKLEQEAQSAIDQLRRHDEKKRQAERERAQALKELEERNENYRRETAYLQAQIDNLCAQQTEVDKFYSQKIMGLNLKVEQMERKAKEERERFRRQMLEEEIARKEAVERLEKDFERKQLKRKQLSLEVQKALERRRVKLRQEQEAKLLQEQKRYDYELAKKREEYARIAEEGQKAINELQERVLAEMRGNDKEGMEVLRRIRMADSVAEEAATEDKKKKEATVSAVESSKDDSSCVVCEEKKEYRVLLTECGHGNLCCKCWNDILAKNEETNAKHKKSMEPICPTCRTPIVKDVVRIPWKIYL
ncbi:hypothetical protein CBR_g51477 [Chara braunii]|uniref:RING-type domain-containing protein n=1 Tax=Chara braunii TaxID=69332 RepID=A0A388K6B8_CHABU|nr:hypothetical protein CBR_g51477 [Chara braunii]|eukprot:GBG65595.1 hypothetical protein CBR_g51477 [Chara braunii]